MASPSGRDSGKGGGAPFPGSRTEWIILLVSFLLAAFVWLIYNLSLRYSVFLDYPVNVVTHLPGHESGGRADQRLMVRGRASGFYIAWRRTRPGRNPLNLKVEGKYLLPADTSGDLFKVDTRFLRKELSSVLGSDVDVEYIVTDTLTFRLMCVASKKVPVRMFSTFSFKPQYMPASPVSITPDSVYVSGSAAAVSTINEVRTQKVALSGIDASVNGVAVLSGIQGVEMSVPEVRYSLSVRRYVEETLTVPVTVGALPPGRKVVLLPDRVEVTFRRYQPIAGMVDADDFSIEIDYDRLVASSSSCVIPSVARRPEGSFGVTLEPEVVECIIMGR